ncbi:MAG: hypothetical protein ABFS17_07135 [Chloroflexota bacterium]
MQYPLFISFKIVAFAPQMSLTDSAGNLLFYVRQKVFKLKEEIKVFNDLEQTELAYAINADRVIDFSAQYNFSDAAGNKLGGVKRQGVKSLLKARYDIFKNSHEMPEMNIEEENPLIRVADGCLNQIPIVNFFTGYFLHPSYLVSSTASTQPLIRLVKEPAFFEGKFKIEKLTEVDPDQEIQILLSLMMMTLLERARG